jgi:hypothetical protein
VFVTAALSNMALIPAYSRLRDSGLAVIEAVPSDASLHLGTTERLRLDVITTAGDEESFGFMGYLCGPRDCTGLTISMKAGHSAAEIAAIVYRLNARLYFESLNGQLGGVRVLDPWRVERVMQELRNYPGLATVNHDELACIAPCTLPASHVIAAIPVDFEPVVPHDGVLQMGAGQTIVFRYSQPDGGLLNYVVRIAP